MPPCFFAIPGDINTLTGGYGYDRKLLQGLQSLGFEIRHLPLPGGFPTPTTQALDATATLLSSLPDNALVLFDGLAYGTLDAVIAPHAQRLRLVALCHHPLALESGLSEQDSKRLHDQEQRALDAARAIVVTSHRTARLLHENFGQPQSKILAALPGTERHGFAACTGAPPLLLSVATLTKRKAHDVLIEALAILRNLPWQARLVGGDDFDKAWAQHLRSLVAQHGLQQRIEFVGERQDLHSEYKNADVFVLPSLFEGYGMAFAEALAFGLPIIGARAGAVPDVVPATAGILVEPGNVAALQRALHDVLTDTALRKRLQQGARLAAEQLPTWEQAVIAVHNLLIKVSKQT